jgi:hypothetical protein
MFNFGTSRQVRHYPVPSKILTREEVEGRMVCEEFMVQSGIPAGIVREMSYGGVFTLPAEYPSPSVAVDRQA